MSDENVWLSQRLTEQRALIKIIDVLEDPALDTADRAVRGAGVSARPAFQEPS